MFLEELLDKHRKYEGKPDLELVRKAHGFAEVAYLRQKRVSEEGLIEHSLAVAEVLIGIRADSTTLAAALLHNVLERSNLGREALAEEFGEEIASLVDGLTTVKAVSVRVASDKGKSAPGGWEDLRYLILATVDDPRILAIRLAEEIHNLRTFTALSERERKVAAQKVLDIWAPLAAIMSLNRLKSELEDLAFALLEPKKYQEIKQAVQKESEDMRVIIEEVRSKLEGALEEGGINISISDRTKHLYGVYRKLPLYKAKAGGKLYDVLGLRVITETVEECYRVLDIARGLWRDVPEFFDDYIAHPKPNGYQSLHIVFVVGDYFVELQIRTQAMHAVAEYGLAAHPTYKEGKGLTEEKIALIRSLVLWEKGQELNLFPDKVFVFTPKGDVKVLPKGATPVDFAYAVHTRIGDECSGAEVGGKLAPLDYQLKTGEVAKILTKKGKKPSSDWLKFVKTDQARDQIGKVLRRR